MIKGDDVELICAASVYNYTDKFTWATLINQTEKLLVQTGNYFKQKIEINFKKIFYTF